MLNIEHLELPYFNDPKSCTETPSKWALSFCGCAFLGAYHIGVLACIREKHPKLMDHVIRIYGSSVGTIIAAVIICGIGSNNAFTLLQSIANSTLRSGIGIFSLTGDICETIRSILIEELPMNIHEIASNRLYINVTRFPSMKAMLISKFESRNDFIDAVICSCYIPLVTSKRVHRYRGKICMDGGLSDNQPTPERCAFSELFNLINVSPFIGEGDIAPKSSHDYCDNIVSISNQNIMLNYANLKRLIDGFNPQNPNTLIKFAYEGYSDTEAYFRRRGNHIQSCISFNEQLSKETTFFPFVSESCESFKNYLKELEDSNKNATSTSFITKLIDFPFKPLKVVSGLYLNVAPLLVYSIFLSGNIFYYTVSKVGGIFSYFKLPFTPRKN